MSTHAFDRSDMLLISFTESNFHANSISIVNNSLDFSKYGQNIPLPLHWLFVYYIPVSSVLLLHTQATEILTDLQDGIGTDQISG